MYYCILTASTLTMSTFPTKCLQFAMSCITPDASVSAALLLDGSCPTPINTFATCQCCSGHWRKSALLRINLVDRCLRFLLILFHQREHTWQQLTHWPLASIAHCLLLHVVAPPHKPTSVWWRLFISLSQKRLNTSMVEFSAWVAFSHRMYSLSFKSPTTVEGTDPGRAGGAGAAGAAMFDVGGSCAMLGLACSGATLYRLPIVKMMYSWKRNRSVWKEGGFDWKEGGRHWNEGGGDWNEGRWLKAGWMFTLRAQYYVRNPTKHRLSWSRT